MWPTSSPRSGRRPHRPDSASPIRTARVVSDVNGRVSRYSPNPTHRTPTRIDTYRGRASRDNDGGIGRLFTPPACRAEHATASTFFFSCFRQQLRTRRESLRKRHAIVARRPSWGRQSSRRKQHVMTTYKVGYFVGSLSSTRSTGCCRKALIRLAPDGPRVHRDPDRQPAAVQPDYDADYPPEATALKEAIAAVRCRPVRHARSTTAPSPAR